MRGFAAGLAGLIVAGAATSGMAQSTDEQLRAYLYEGRIAEGLEAMAMLAPDDGAGVFGHGLLAFVSGVEALAQAYYRHGFDPGQALAGSPLLGIPRLPSTRTTSIEPLTYEDFRGYLVDFADQMDAAKTILLEASADTGFAVEIDILSLRIDIDGDGVTGPAESIGGFLASAAGMSADFGLGMDVEEMPVATFAFDAADAIWLAGYSQVLAFHADFLLAHDFGTFFEAGMHRLFPGAGLPMERLVPSQSLIMDRDTDALIADAIAIIHTLNWEVTDPTRLRLARDRLLEVLALSRRNWAAILAETDDNLEFIPSPSQTPVHEDMAISKAMVTAWHETLDAVEAIAKGELLLPHWRFSNVGFDLSLYFETASRTDLVLLLTGYGALPYMREGPVATAEDFAAANEVFGDAIWGYALWFN